MSYSAARSRPLQPPLLSNSDGRRPPSPEDDWDRINGHAVPMMLGRLLERSDHTITQLGRIESRMEAGDQRMGEMTERIAALEQRPDAIPSAERWVKDALRYAVPLGVLYGTGSLEAAQMWLKMLIHK